jgi:multiple sugar transport system substrate-binding protein
MVETMLAQFHEAHPDVRVFFTPDPDNLADAMLADMQAGTAPDVFWGGSTFFPTWAQQGYMLDLRPYVAAALDAATIADWDPAQYRAFFLRDGLQFGLPKYHGAVALYYNKAHFDAAGVAYPTATWTHAEYLAAMQQLSQPNADGVRDLWGSMIDIAWDRLQIYVNSWGGHLVAPYDSAYCVADEAPATAALEWLRARMWDDRVMAGFPDVQYMSPRSAFINQRVAMVEEGSWVLRDVLLNSDFPVGVAPLPRGPAQRATLATSDGFGIFAETQYPDAAWALLEFLTGEAYGLALAKTDFLQPARASLIDEWIGFIQAEFPAKAKDLDVGAFADGHLQGYSVTVEIAENMAEVEPKMTAAFEQIFTLGQAPVSSLQAVCAQINQLQRGNHGPWPRLAE